MRRRVFGYAALIGRMLDAQRVLGVLGKRLARYGLTLHPGKTRFVDFRNTESTGTTHPEAGGTTFTFLGFTHIWGKSRAAPDGSTQHERDMDAR